LSYSICLFHINVAIFGSSCFLMVKVMREQEFPHEKNCESKHTTPFDHVLFTARIFPNAGINFSSLQKGSVREAIS